MINDLRESESLRKCPYIIIMTLFLHISVLQSVKIYCRENVHEDKNTKIKSCENELIYSIISAEEIRCVFDDI